MSSTRRTVNRIAAALLAISALALSGVAWAENPARLRRAALVEEADLLLEELAGLQPVIERLRVEGERLAAAQTALRAELAGLEREIAAYNEAAGALAEGARQHRGRCPRESEDSGLIERCNAAGAELMDRYAVLERQRAACRATAGAEPAHRSTQRRPHRGRPISATTARASTPTSPTRTAGSGRHAGFG
jgi:hypothetical protein